MNKIKVAGFNYSLLVALNLNPITGNPKES